MSRSRAWPNFFLVSFFSALALTALTDSHQWPFMAYDMYARDMGALRFNLLLAGHRIGYSRQAA